MSWAISIRFSAGWVAVALAASAMGGAPGASADEGLRIAALENIFAGMHVSADQSKRVDDSWPEKSKPGSLVFPDALANASVYRGGTWSVDAAGTVSLTGVTDGTADYALQFYVDGNGHVLAITLDDGDVLGGRGAQQSGSNFTASNFSGAYSFGTTGWDYNNVDEFDAVGPVTADGVGIVAGFTDYNWFGSGVTFPNSPMSGAFTSASSGVFTGTITGLDADTCTIFGMGGGCNTDAFSYYLIDAAGENIAIETDPSQLTLGEFIQQ